MAIRTSADAVAEIIEVDEDIPLDPFITAASLLVDRVERRSLLLATDEQLTDDELVVIETWLAAHFYAARDPRPERERAGSVETKYQTAVDLNLANTHYGQNAMIIDATGYLKEVNATSFKRRKVSVDWLGTAWEERELN